MLKAIAYAVLYVIFNNVGPRDMMWAADPTDQETENLIKKYCNLDVAQTVGIARGRDGWTFFRKQRN
jgi:hypothetical protein